MDIVGVLSAVGAAVVAALSAVWAGLSSVAGGVAPTLTAWWAGLSADAKDVLKAVASPTVAILLFVATQIVQSFFAASMRRKERDRMVVGIYREIADNLAQNANTQFTPSLVASIKAAITKDDTEARKAGRDPKYRPFIAITESSKFYDSVAGALPGIKTKSLIAVCAYYRSVFDQTLIAEGINGPAFHSISLDSRLSLIDELQQGLVDSARLSRVAIESLRRQYGSGLFKGLPA